MTIQIVEFMHELLLLFKKVSSARQGESDIHPISPKTPAPQYQPIDRLVLWEGGIGCLLTGMQDLLGLLPVIVSLRCLDKYLNFIYFEMVLIYTIKTFFLR